MKYIIKLPPNAVTAGIGALVISENEIIYTFVKEVFRL
jgi:hypothetical protein